MCTLIGASLVCAMRQMSPCSTLCSKTVSPAELVTTILPADATSKVLSCEPYLRRDSLSDQQQGFA